MAEYINKFGELVRMLRDYEILKADKPTNDLASRVLELESLYINIHAVTGYKAEQLLDMFKAGYTLTKPDYAKDFDEMWKLAISKDFLPIQDVTTKGKWIEEKYKTTSSARSRKINNTKNYCSICQKSNGRRKTDFCPKCGAKMDRE